MKKLNYASLSIIGIIVLVAALRVAQVFPPNFAPVTALCLLGSAYFSRKWMAFIIPTAVLALSDIFIGGGKELISVYFAYALIILLGFALNNNVKPLRVLATTLGASVLFYVVTNFFCWYGSPYYTQDLGGFTANYVGALPYFRTSLVSDLGYSALFFTAFEQIRVRFPQFSIAK